MKLIAIPLFALLAIIGLISSCTEKKNEVPMRFYAGPLISTRNLVTTYLDSGKTRLKMEAKVQLEYEDGDQEFPEGFFVSIFDEDGKLRSILKADFVHYDKVQNLYTATGNVFLEDQVKKESLKTTKLHWSKSEERVFNNEYVEINTPSQVLKGKGLTARQDFSSYTILEPEGTIKDADSDGFF
jgi:LPS export ABC transporter protein LptC